MIAILGAGAFGTALAIALSTKEDVRLWARDPSRAGARLAATSRPKTEQSEQDTPSAALPLTLPERVQVTGSLDTLPETVLLAVPAQALAGFLRDHADRLAGRRLVSCAKGIDLASGRGPTAMIRDIVDGATPAVLTGPSFAADIARGLPTALTLACADEVTGAALQHQLSTPALRLYRTHDVTGAELGGALKNVIAIAAGAAIGAGLGESARAAILTRGFAEMNRFAIARGARAETLAGLSGLGDLVLTATSDLSRNYRFGHALGTGAGFDPTVTVEGVATARAVAAIARTEGQEMPISATVAALAGGLGVGDAIRALLSRPLKEE